MKSYASRALLLLAIAFTMIGCAGQKAVDDDGGVFVHIKSGPAEAHSVMMGLQMAKIMAEQRDVLVYLDVDGIMVVLKDAPVIEKQPFGTSQSIIQGLIDAGVPVYACPGCIKAHGKTPADLMQGVQVADKQAFFSFTEGRILTLDY